MLHELIQRYEEGASALHDAVRGLTLIDLNAPPPAGSSGSWTLQQIIVHTYDSDLIGVHRMRRVIAEPRPLLIGYDETPFANELFYGDMDVTTVAEAYRLNRVIMSAALRLLLAQKGAAAFERWGVHNEVGKKTLADFVRSYIEHTEHHMKFIREKRMLLGKPMR